MTCDQYTIQGDVFSRTISEGAEVLAPLENALKNKSIFDAVFRSMESGAWESPDNILIEADGPEGDLPQGAPNIYKVAVRRHSLGKLDIVLRE